MSLIAQINGTAAFVASVNGSTPFNITAATSSEFVASMATIGPAGSSSVATATFPVIYTSETQNISIEPDYFALVSALDDYLLSATAATTYYLQTNPAGFITSAALTPYLTSATAATTYQTITGMSSYLTTAAAASTYYLQTNPSNFITSAALSGYATETWVGEQGYALNSSLADYLPLAGGTMTGGINLPDGGGSVGYDEFLGTGYLILNKPSDGAVMEFTATGILFPDGNTQTVAYTGQNIFDQSLNIADSVQFAGVSYYTATAPSNQYSVTPDSIWAGIYDGSNITRTIISSNGVTFPDGTIQTTAVDGGDFLPLAGGTMTGAIIFGTAGQNIDVGSFDNGTGGANGISLNCAVNYELNWQGGFLENRYSGTSYPIGLNSNLIFGTIASGIYTEISSNGSIWVTGDNSAYGEYTKQRFYIGTSGASNPVWIDASLNIGTSGNPSIQILPDGATGSAMKIDGFGLTFPDTTVQTTAATGYDQNLNIGSGVSFGSVTITDASTNLTLSGSIQFGDASVQTTAFPPTGGTALQYIDGTGALQTFPAGSAATTLETTVYNNSGVTIPKHSVVYINGRHGNDPTIALSQANAEATSRATFGFTKADIPDHSLGTVVQVGLLEDVHYTLSIAEGALLFLSPSVAGGWTDIQPSSPNHYVNVGTAIRVHPTQGTIQVRIQNSNELNELSDVQVSSAVAGDLLVSNGSGYWVNQSLATAGIAPVASPTFTGTATFGAGAITTTVSNAEITLTSGGQVLFLDDGGITFPDASLQTTAFPPAGGTTSQYIDGTGALKTLPVINIQTFGSAGATSTVTGTWTKPAGAKMVEIHMWGAGGGGAGGSCQAIGTARNGGGGGRNGSYSIYRIPASDLDATCDYGCPVGGAGGAGRSTAGSGSAGGNTSTLNGSPYFYVKASPTTLLRSVGGLGGAGAGTGGSTGQGNIFNIGLGSTGATGGAGTTAAGTAASNISSGLFVAGSGGGGAGAAAAVTTNANGGNGSSRNANTGSGISTALAGGSGGTALGVQATAGADGNPSFAGGMGGGGGFYRNAVAGGTGGAGGYPSGGGGGGGASDFGFLSGTGGKGGNSRIVVITYF